MPTSGFNSGFNSGFGFSGVGQLLLVTGDHPTYEDGDVLVAKNRRAIRFDHAQRICWPRNNGRKVGGQLGDSQPLLEILLGNIYQYKFERLSRTELRITRLSDGETLRIESGAPFTHWNGKTQHMEIEEFVERRLDSGKLPMFGSEGAEIWYGGRTDASHDKLDTVWAEIESRTAEREADYVDWPFTPRELQRFLAISVDDFDDAESGELTAPLMDETDPENPVRVKKRKHSIDWRGLRDVVEADVLDFTKQVDMRHARKQVRAVTVQTKSL